jgi:hypothetical protein
MLRVRRLLAAPLSALTLSVALVGGPVAQAQVGQIGLVNVSVGNVTILEDVNLAVAANVAATVCGVAVQVGVIAQQLQDTGAFRCGRGNQRVLIEQAQ